MSTSAPAAGAARVLDAFGGCGIELEYALVRSDDLDVAPVADEALRRIAGSDDPVSEVRQGMFGWSNEIVLHVLEVKNVDPTVPMDLLAARFGFEVREMNAALADLGVRLMPSGMHPWMEPRSQTRLWPHDNAPIYRAYDRIFDCRTHGYANLQSMHVNLPFADDTQFARLHDALRLILPILPALGAASPFIDGACAANRCQRMSVYAGNARRVPQLTGDIVPERCAGREAYEREVLEPMYRAIAPLDGERVMNHEWLNARGAIARFERNAIEIRVLDTQECPRMDIGIAALLIDLAQALYEARLASAGALRLSTARLRRIFDACVHAAEYAVIDDADFLAGFGILRPRCHAGYLWECIGAMLESCGAPRRALWHAPLDHILTRGTLACRLLAAAGVAPDRRRLRRVYGQLCDALQSGAPLD